MISRSCHHVTNTLFFFSEGEKDLSHLQKRCSPVNTVLPAILSALLLQSCTIFCLKSWPPPTKTGHRAAASGMHSCTKRKGQSLIKPSAEQSLNMLSSLQNQFVYCYRMQDKDLKSALVLELHQNSLTQYIQIYKINVFLFS